MEDETERLAGKIAFVCQADSFWQVWIRDIETDETGQLTQSPTDKRTPKWFPNGEKIAYRTTSGAFEIVSVKTGNIEALVPSLGFLVDPALSASGKHLAFARFEPEPDDNTNLFIYSLIDRNLVRVSDSTDLEYFPAWSPDETKIAYIGGRGSSGNLLRIMNADGSGKKVLQRNMARDSSPCWSPDGKFIVFSSDLSGDYELWKVPFDGTSMTRLTDSPGLDNHPYYAPDGSRIVFTSRRSGLMHLWTMKPDGSDPRMLFPDTKSEACDPHWWQPPPAEGRSR